MITEGKTKKLTLLGVSGRLALVTTKNDITAGDGARHDVMQGKDELSTRTTCNVFEYLSTMGIPLAYVDRDGPTTFFTQVCTMIPVEVVVRRIATGSFIKRHPEVKDGAPFETPLVEFYYKTTGRQIGSTMLPCDDPLMVWNEEKERYDLYLPNKPRAEGLIGPLELDSNATRTLSDQLAQCAQIARDVSMHLATAWQALGGDLYDFKVEFGFLPSGKIVVADVIDCDSWRVVWNGIKLSKQGYRDGDDVKKVLEIYRQAAALTDQML